MPRRTLVLFSLTFLITGCDGAATSPADLNGAATVLPSGGSASVVFYPSADHPGPPFYARIEPDYVITEDGWAVIPFYRDPACVPESFNLLAFFDAPAAFGCLLLVEGISVWQGEAFVGAPRISQAQARTDVSFWFIPATSVFDAMQDGVLTIGELAALPGRIAGTASHFTEVLHPHPLPPFLGGGGHPNPKLVLSAQGELEDGRRFTFHLTRNDRDVRSVQLRFR
jgi:hypothetical protein